MRLRMSDRSPLKRPFVAVGAVIGTFASIWYLYRNFRLAVPDPVWTRFVNVSLILFSAIYVANMLRRLIELVRKKEKPE